MTPPADREQEHQESGKRVARQILADIVSSFVLTEDPSHLLQAHPHLDEEVLQDGKPTVVARMFKNAAGKAALAELYTQAISQPAQGPEPLFRAWASDFLQSDNDELSIFIESGSTLLFVSDALRRVFQERSPRRLLVRTNNHLTAWLLLNKKHQDCLVPFLFSGALEEKYHGLFPFFIGGKPGEVADERAAYAQSRFDMARCDVLLLAASRLSLCHGPLVGSLENALFKHASYSACVPRLDHESHSEIHLLITADKLVAHEETYPSGFNSITDELKKVDTEECHPVFDLRLQGSGQRPTITKSPFSDKLCPATAQPLRDGTRAVQFGDARFRICDTWEQLLSQGRLKVRVFISHRDDDVAWIRREIDFALEYFRGAIDIQIHPFTSQPVFGRSMSCLVLRRQSSP
jgi:hypothetical protein